MNKVCPKGCSGGYADRQRDLLPAEAAKIGPVAWLPNARRCTYCGAVYAPSGTDPRQFRGWLDAPMIGQGWQPR
jgi:hypothetical protein